MKHAGPATFAALADLLDQIRTRPLVEKRPGVFYRRSQAFLHFHDDPAGIFADIRDGAAWQRFAVNGPDERRALLARLDELLA